MWLLSWFWTEEFHRMWDVIELMVWGYDMQFSEKNTKLLWTACRSPFLGKSPHRAFSFNAMLFIVNFQLAMKTIKVIINWTENVHEGHTSSDLAVFSAVALGAAHTGYVGCAGLSSILFNIYQGCVGRDLILDILYLFLFLYACSGNYSFGEQKGPSNLGLTCS